MGRIRGVLFDVDGTLLDSNDAHAHAWLDALRGHGRSMPYEVVRSRVGMAHAELLREAASVDLGSVEGRSIAERRAAILRAHYLPDVGPFAGARVLVDRLRSRGLAVAATATGGADELAELLRAAGVADLVDVRISGDEAVGSRVVDVALDRLGVDADELLFVGDTPYDVAAAEQAGVAAVAFRCGGAHEEDLERALAVYDGPADLSAKLADSPVLRAERDTPSASFVKSFARRTAMRGA